MRSLSEHDAETLQDLKESYKEWLKQIPKSVREKLNEERLSDVLYPF